MNSPPCAVQGQLDDFSYILATNGLPSFSNPYLFNGDFVDRGFVRFASLS